MISKHIDEITADDIKSLITNSVRESKTLEYKQILPGGQDKDKKEFLADISSFANSSGGDIIYGIKEAKDENGKNTGEAEEIIPIEGVSIDEGKLKIESMIRDGIDPRINVKVKEVTGFDKNEKEFVIIVRIPESISSPHMITFKGSSKFYSRNSAGKFQLDVDEIKNAFLATDSQSVRIRNFLQDRLSKVNSEETPVKLSSKSCFVLHVIPVTNFLNNVKLAVSSFKEQIQKFKPIGGGWDSCFNLDGFYTYTMQDSNGKSKSYCQVFYNGAIELVYSGIVSRDNYKTIASTSYEINIHNATRDYFEGYKKLDINSPIILSVTFLGCKGVYFLVNPTVSSDNKPPLDRNVAIMPEVMINNIDDNLATILKPVFDATWNAFGYPKSYNYTDNGTWNVRV